MHRLIPPLTITLATSLAGTACSPNKPTPPISLLEQYVGCYAIGGVGSQTRQRTSRTLRLTSEEYWDPSNFPARGYLASLSHATKDYYWFVTADTIHVRPRRDRNVPVGPDSLDLWPTRVDFAGRLGEVTDVVGADSRWDLVAHRVRCTS